ncbi:MAG: hypothetical protein V3T30_03600 [Thermodesulfobacteriota bacterium]
MGEIFSFSSIYGAFLIFFVVSIGVLLVLRIMLPFSIMNIKEVVGKSYEEQLKTNELLKEMLAELRKDKANPTRVDEEGD